ncbi:hypothetical protein PS623_04624 [Pseudomonas fluorescens]|nr:hypothetical protein PS623_04624 [Pseudomonas fluorescens]
MESAHAADSPEAKLADAETRAAQWLADGNEAWEKGRVVKAERCYQKAQFWLDRANKLSGKAD